MQFPKKLRSDIEKNKINDSYSSPNFYKLNLFLDRHGDNIRRLWIRHSLLNTI